MKNLTEKDLRHMLRLNKTMRDRTEDKELENIYSKNVDYVQSLLNALVEFNIEEIEVISMTQYLTEQKPGRLFKRTLPVFIDKTL